MRANKQQMLAKGSARQKVTIAVLIVVVLVVGWQVFGLFRHGSSTPSTPARPGANATAAMAAAPSGAPTPQAASVVTPVQSPLQRPKALTQNEIELLRLQQATQAKYLAALNELQMLKVSREIAETNLAIVNAKLATVTAEKNIVTALTPPAPPPVPPAAYAKGLATPAPAATSTTYTVVSVSQLEGEWTAVLGSQGNLYNVHIGDVMPADGEKVVAINRNGVVLSKDGQTRRLSLVPII